MKTKKPLNFLITAILILTIDAGIAKFASAESKSSTPQQVFDGMRRSFRAEKAKGLNARYQFDLDGPEGGQWFVDLNDGTLKMARGQIEHPNVTLITSDKDWVALSNGDLSGTWAFLTGRLKIRGDHSLARKLGEIFP